MNLILFCIFSDLIADLSAADVEGIYETQVPLLFRALLKLGCVCAIDKSESRRLSEALTENQTFMLNNLSFRTVAQQSYLEVSLYYVLFLYKVRHFASFF